MKIKEIYSELKRMGVCRTAYEFSENYLGKKKNYYSVILAKKREPTIEVYLTLAEALSVANRYIIAGDNEELLGVKKRIKEMARELRKEIRQACRENLWYVF